MDLRLPVFGSAVFLSALLLFQIQPLIGKYILPWFGGVQAVWTTCLLVFQSLLFGGYAYAHLIGRLNLRLQSSLHGGLLLLAGLIPVVPAESWKPAGGESPLPQIVAMLLATVGLPFFALSATGPLLQAWFWRVRPDRSPYPLYALSNAGSLIALVSYPFLVEPNLSGAQQAWVWRLGFLVFVVLGGLTAWCVWRTGGASQARPPEAKAVDEGGQIGRPLLWVAWSACGVVMFMATTNQITLNVASMPFLWVLPLGAYLLAFIVAFSGHRRYPRGVFAPLLLAAVIVYYLLIDADVNYDSRSELTLTILQQIAAYAAALFVVCLVCNGELYRLKPPPHRLTSFYLSIAGGGALGGIVVGVLAPMLFLLYQELQLGLVLCCVLYLATGLADPSHFLYLRRRRWAGGLAAVGVLALCWLLVDQTRFLLKDTIDTSRNFFGVLRVVELSKDHPRQHSFQLIDGAIAHGHQLAHPDAQHLPTLYYASITGIGQALGAQDDRGGRRVGVVGLGVGTLAAYGRPGDSFRFYEINPDVLQAARTHFTFLNRTQAELEVVLGDARLSLENEASQQFDFLILDAFSSDAIPVHLLTVEAFRVYERHLKGDGVLALHVSNLHFDLPALVHRLAEARDLQSLTVVNRYRPERLALDSTWMFLSRQAAALEKIATRVEPLLRSGDVALTHGSSVAGRSIPLWTDNDNNLFRILK